MYQCKVECRFTQATQYLPAASHHKVDDSAFYFSYLIRTELETRNWYRWSKCGRSLVLVCLTQMNAAREMSSLNQDFNFRSRLEAYLYSERTWIPSWMSNSLCAERSLFLCAVTWCYLAALAASRLHTFCAEYRKEGAFRSVQNGNTTHFTCTGTHDGCPKESRET